MADKGELPAVAGKRMPALRSDRAYADAFVTRSAGIAIGAIAVLPVPTPVR